MTNRYPCAFLIKTNKKALLIAIFHLALGACKPYPHPPYCLLRKYCSFEFSFPSFAKTSMENLVLVRYRASAMLLTGGSVIDWETKNTIIPAD